MTTDIALFLAHAVALEQEAADRYDELADAMETHNRPEICELFHKLAHFSRLHLAEVKGIAEGHDLPKLKPWEFQWEGGESPEAAPTEMAHYMMTPHHCLTMALFNEKKGRDYYAQQAEGGKTEEVRKLAALFASEESEHVVMLEKWLDTVDAPSDDWDEDMDPPVITD